MKKIILILIGIAVVLFGVIFVIYKNSENSREEVIDIFKEEIDEEKEELSTEDEKEDNKNKVVVDIKGMVANPGVYDVDSTFRVNDVISLAGGLIEGADTSLINLAKIVEDEMIIIIYSKEELLEKFKDEVCICDCPEIKNDACIEVDTEQNMLVNINIASKEDLIKVPGIGESKAEAIIEYRDANGKFNNIEDIRNVSGIGEALFEKIKDYITV